MTQYMRGIKAALDDLYIQKGTILFYGLKTECIVDGVYVETTSQWLATLDRWIEKLRGLLEANCSPKN